MSVPQAAVLSQNEQQQAETTPGTPPFEHPRGFANVSTNVTRKGEKREDKLHPHRYINCDVTNLPRHMLCSCLFPTPVSSTPIQEAAVAWLVVGHPPHSVAQ